MSHVSSIELRKVRPEAVNEKSVLESVAGLLQEVVDKVPQAYAITSRPSNPEQFETIEWMRFLSNGHEWHPSIRSDTLILLIAYKTGLSLWTIESNGIANELFSIREHNLTSVCLLINNNNTNSIQDDPYSSQRPLFAFAKSAGPPSVQIRSLKNDQQSLKIITLPGIGQQSEPLWIESNKNVLICATHTFLIGYDLLKFDEKFFISNCYSSIPFTLSTRWLAFADSRLSLIHQSAGGINGTISDQYVSYTGVVFNAAKSSFKSMVKIGESMFGYGTNNSQMNNSNLNDKTLGNQQQQMQLGTSPTSGSANSNPGRHRHGSGKEEIQPGIVTIVDTIKLFGSTIHDERQNWIIAHFQAHADPIGYLQFNPTGHLLVTCDQSGHYFNVLEIKASPYRCTRTYIKHLYTLFRGDTDCRVSHMTFSYDSRWLAVSTKRGTTHLYAINPYGGAANVGTHTTPRVVNKPPRFNRNMGYDDLQVRSSNPSNTETNSKDSSSTSCLSQSPSNSTTNYNMNSARTKRANTECVYTTATTLIRQPTESFVSGISAPFNSDSICVASSFGASRGFLNPEDMNKQEQTACDSLFVISWHGRLIEYVLEPVADMSKHGVRVTNETPITLKANPKAQWFLQKLLAWSEVRTSTGYSFLSQGHRPTSANKVHSKDDWLRQIDIVTQMGPHRRLWMGPQFHFKHYKDTTGSVCLPDSNSVLVDESPREDMNRSDDNLTSLPIERSKSIPLHVPDANNKDVARAFIEVGSFNSHDGPLLSIYGTSQDSSRSDDLVDRLADAANETPFKYNDETIDPLISSSASGTIVRPLQTNHSIENMSAFPDPAD